VSLGGTPTIVAYRMLRTSFPVRRHVGASAAPAPFEVTAAPASSAHPTTSPSAATRAGSRFPGAARRSAMMLPTRVFDAGNVSRV
jgi:hypothetical protein